MLQPGRVSSPWIPSSIAATSSGAPCSTTFCAASRVLPLPRPALAAARSLVRPDSSEGEIFPSRFCFRFASCRPCNLSAIRCAIASRSVTVKLFRSSFSSCSAYPPLARCRAVGPVRASWGVSGYPQNWGTLSLHRRKRKTGARPALLGSWWVRSGVGSFAAAGAQPACSHHASCAMSASRLVSSPISRAADRHITK